MKKVLLTGFQPFGGESINPSWLAVERVQAPENVHLIKQELPVTFRGAAAALRALMDEHKPDYVISVGQAGGRKAVTVEYVAVNLMDGADNDGFNPGDTPVTLGGENALFATVPVKNMVQAMKAENIPAARSLSAGAYVCNCVLYTALHYARAQGMDTQCGFIHVPFIPEQTAGKDAPALPLCTIVQAITCALHVLAEM